MTQLRIFFVVSLLITGMSAPAQSNPLSQLGGLGRLGGNSSLIDTKIASGLKDALSVGTKNAVHLVDKPGGYLDNQAIKILLPKSLQEKDIRRNPAARSTALLKEVFGH
jgi:hypothetical protein